MIVRLIPIRRLPPRERQAARLIAQGLENKEIAAQMGITLQTVKNMVHHIFHRLGARNRAHIVSLLFVPRTCRGRKQNHDRMRNLIIARRREQLKRRKL